MSKKIFLLIDDDPIISLVHQEVILNTYSNAEVIRANTGDEALKKLKNSPSPHYIFLDINMPVMNGFAFLDKLLVNKPEFMRFTKVILVTSSVNPLDIDRSKQYECVIDFVSKPLTRSYMTQLLSKA